MVLEKGVIFAGKYEIIDTLSVGAQASVYTARQKPLDRIVILKILSPALTANQEIVARFEREAKLLSTLKDESITQIYDYGRDNNIYFFVSEYIEGQSIKEVLEAHGKLTPQAAAYIILEAAKVLSRLHKQNIIHRDIKPGNIIISKDGKVKLTDFGLAFSQALPSLTIEGSILGTPAYMPPEQILGKAIDKRADIYSLGIVFYELLSGVNPFIANTYSAIMHNVLNTKLTPLYKLEPSLEENRVLWQIIEQMTKKSSAERCTSMNEVSEKLRIWFDKDANKSWQIDIKSISQHGTSTITQPSVKKQSVLRIISIFALLIIVSTMIVLILINQIRKSKLNNSLAVTNLTNTGQIVNNQLDTNQDSIQVNNTETIKIQNKNSEEIPNTWPDLQIKMKTFSNVKIQVLPWATVYLDGKEIFTTPKDTTLILTSGQHNLKLVNPNFPVIESVLMLRSEPVNLFIDLRERVGYLQISVTPWADIYIDDVFRATTPIAQPLIVSAGKHRLTVKNPYYAQYNEIIDFIPQKTIERNIVLQ